MAEKNHKPTRLEWAVLLFTALFAAGSLLFFFLGGRGGDTLVLSELSASGVRHQEAVDAPGMLEGEILDLNTVSAGELTRLPGIGERRAADIVAWREAHGGFQSVEEIQEVSGIGPGIFARIQPYICVTPQGEGGEDNGAHSGG